METIVKSDQPGIPRKKNISEQKADNAKWGFIFGLFINTAALIAAIISNSLVAISDTANGFTETLSIFLTWLAMKRASQGQSQKFNYGQGKMENLASIGVALALIISFILIVKNAVYRLQHPATVNISGILAYLVLAGIALFCNTFFWLRAYRLACITPSPAIEAQWRLYRVKTVCSGYVFISMGLNVAFRSEPWSVYLDPSLSFVVAGMILVSAYKIFTKSIYDLLDGVLEENIQLVIMRELARNFDEYEDFHGVRSRRVGSGIFIELFLQFDESRTMREVQKSIEKIKGSLEEALKESQVMIVPCTEKIL